MNCSLFCIVWYFDCFIFIFVLSFHVPPVCGAVTDSCTLQVSILLIYYPFRYYRLLSLLYYHYYH